MKLKHKIFTSLLAGILILSAAYISFFVLEDAENTLTGRATTIVNIQEAPPTNCSVFLYEGFNMASFFCETESIEVNESLKDANGNTLGYYSIFEYNPSSSTDKWKSYNPYLPNWTTQDLTFLSRKKGYWIFMNSSGTYFKSGLRTLETITPLSKGWNLVGYTSNVTKNTSYALQSILGFYTVVRTYERASGYWYEHFPPDTGNLTEMNPMRGYWINTTDAVDWDVTW